MDWKLTLMKILDAVGAAEGIWFEPWEGVSAEEQKEIEREYETYKLDERPGFQRTTRPLLPAKRPTQGEGRTDE